MKKVYVKPVLNASMEGTLEGVYAYGNVMGLCVPNVPKDQPSGNVSKNEGGCNSQHGKYFGIVDYKTVCFWGRSYTFAIWGWIYY